MDIADRAARDLTDEEVRKDMAHQLRRAQEVGDDAAMAHWARRWGDAIVHKLLPPWMN